MLGSVMNDTGLRGAFLEGLDQMRNHNFLTLDNFIQYAIRCEGNAKLQKRTMDQTAKMANGTNNGANQGNGYPTAAGTNNGMNQVHGSPAGASNGLTNGVPMMIGLVRMCHLEPGTSFAKDAEPRTIHTIW